MKDFKSFLSSDADDLDDKADGVDESVINDAMWNFIEKLDDTVLEGLNDEMIGDYVDIVEAVADMNVEEEETGLTEGDKEILKKYQFKDAFTLKDDEAAPLLKKKLIVANKGKGTFSITDKGKDFVESVEMDEAMPAKRVRRDVIQKRKASREHRKVKAKKKLAGRRKRKTAGFKRYKKKAKRLGKRGLTSTGKRKRTFINKG